MAPRPQKRPLRVWLMFQAFWVPPTKLHEPSHTCKADAALQDSTVVLPTCLSDHLPGHHCNRDCRNSVRDATHMFYSGQRHDTPILEAMTGTLASSAIAVHATAETVAQPHSELEAVATMGCSFVSQVLSLLAMDRVHSVRGSRTISSKPIKQFLQAAQRLGTH